MLLLIKHSLNTNDMLLL